VKTVKQTLSREEQRRVFQLLKANNLTPQMLFRPSLSGMTMPVLLVQVPEDQFDAAKELLRKEE